MLFTLCSNAFGIQGRIVLNRTDAICVSLVREILEENGVTRNRKIRRAILGVLLYAAFCTIGGIFLASVSLRPARRPLTENEIELARESARNLNAEMENESVTTEDGIVLHAWRLCPRRGNGDDVILLHGLGDNRMGMIGYAQVLVADGFTVLMPDARAHGVSGGELATFGLRERDDIRQWTELLEAKDHPRCVFGFGESMGAAQLLESLGVNVPFCAVAAESPFASFREIAYDRMGQPFHLGPWMGKTLFRPVVEVGLLRARWKYGLNLEDAAPEDAVARTTVPVLLIHGKVDSNIPVRHSRMILARTGKAGIQTAKVQLWEVEGADHCGAISADRSGFEQRLIGWFFAHDAAGAPLAGNR